MTSKSIIGSSNLVPASSPIFRARFLRSSWARSDSDRSCCNYGGWTVDDVYDLWETYFYLDSAEDVRDVYDACMAEPGTILSYSIGYYQICDLEEEVKEMLSESLHPSRLEAAL